MEPKPPHKIRAVGLVCRHCGAENPPKAYCCLSCFKVLRPKENLPFWQREINPGAKGLLIVGIFFLGTVWGIHRWLTGVNAELSMHVESADYNVSVVANKRRASIFHLKKNSKEATVSRTTAPASDDAETASGISQP